MKNHAFIFCAVSAAALWSVGRVFGAPPPPPAFPSLLSFRATGRLEVVTAGCGNSTGHVADLRLRNLTADSLRVEVPPLLLESRSGKFQHYACPFGQTIRIAAQGTATVPLEGLCLIHARPAVGNGVTGELLPNDGNPNLPRPAGSHFTSTDARKLLRVAESYYLASQELERRGAYRHLPYRDSQTRTKVATQVGVWQDPQVAKLTGTKPVTKQEIEHACVDEQENKQPFTPETKEKLEQGVEEVSKAVTLTTQEAKVHERPDPFAKVELTGQKAKTNG